MVPLMLLLSQLVGLEGHFLVISPTTQLELLIFAGPIVLMLFLSFYFFFNESPVYPKKKRKRMSCLSWFKIFHCKCRFPRLRHKNHILCSYLFFFWMGLILLPTTTYSSMPGVLLGLAAFELHNMPKGHPSTTILGQIELVSLFELDPLGHFGFFSSSWASINQNKEHQR